MLLQGKTAVVTGANRGIGSAILAVLARNGANVIACTREPREAFSQDIAALGAETGVKITAVHFDLGNRDAVKAGAKEIANLKVPIDILVNNAGVIATAPFMMTSEKIWDDMHGVNIMAPILLAQHLSRLMVRQRKGSIINVASSAAIEGNEGRSAYAASKAAIIAATKVMSRELGPAGIRVNVIAPGLTQTDMMTQSTAKDALEATVARTSMRRVGEPEEIANAVLFLASDLSSYVTGHTLRVDGGM